ncbi:S-adenosyl-l-methionine hydroxide adenosyltransferase family protein [Lutibacter holmesii]|uniref:S-adenosyl-l-methionine hydroxide adenosyltransferase family protein n=1 Tax=Lutibacter holmesii TaxID=1137985 RepID=A0ABW3WT42_9FLAO
MSIITLTTDFGIKDHFVGAIKGTIYGELPNARIVDISHQISPFNITETAYILKNAYKSFPEGSIHIIGVDSELNEINKHIALKLDNHYFICPDNGIISLLASEIKPEKIVEINIHDRVSTSFPVLDVFVKVACHISRGGTLEVIGKVISEYKKLVELQPNISDDKKTIQGNIIYIDNYGNSISNINRKLFNEVGKGRDFEVIANKYTFNKINNKYSDIIDFSETKDVRQKDGTRLAIFNSANYLEIAMYRSNLNTVGGASSLLGLNYRDVISIKFT